MKNNYLCDMCSCYLEPGAGLLCNACRKELRARARKSDGLRTAVRDYENREFGINTQEAKNEFIYN